MLVLKIVVTVAAVIALTSAWSTRFSRAFDAFPPPSPQLPFGPFFLQQDSFLQPQPPPRYSNAHRSPPPPPLLFQHPLHLYQQPPTTALAAAPRPPVQPPAAQDPRLVNQVHHLHHVIYHFYLPAPQVGERSRNDRQPSSRKPCNDCYYPVATTECPPLYLPPPLSPLPSPSPPLSPSPPPPPPPPPPSPTPLPSPTPPPPSSPTQAPCEDDTVVVDNPEYFPFGRSPIVVATEATGVRRGVVEERGQDDRPRGRENNKSAFILANYLLPPDK